MDSFSRGELTFPVRDAGGCDRPAVVLLHGFPQDGSAWDQVTPTLVAAGLRTLVPDQRGYAVTATPRGRRSYGLDDLALDVVALLDAAGIQRAHIVGHDWGGAVLWHLASRHANRVRTATVLSTPHPGALVWSLTRSRQALSSSYMAFFQLPQLPERLLAPRLRRFYRRTGLPAEHAERYAVRFAQPRSLTGPLGWYRSVPLHRTTTGRSRVPTTLVWGTGDVALGGVAARRTGHHVRSEYRFVEVDAGHWLPETHPHLVASEVLRHVDGG